MRWVRGVNGKRKGQAAWMRGRTSRMCEGLREVKGGSTEKGKTASRAPNLGTSADLRGRRGGIEARQQLYTSE